MSNILGLLKEGAIACSDFILLSLFVGMFIGFLIFELITRKYGHEENNRTAEDADKAVEDAVKTFEARPIKADRHEKTEEGGVRPKMASEFQRDEERNSEDKDDNEGKG